MVEQVQRRRMIVSVEMRPTSAIALESCSHIICLSKGMVKSKGKERKGKMRWFLKVGSHRQRHLYRSCALQLQVPTLLHQPRSFSFDVAEREGFDIFTASKPSFIHPTAIVPPDAVIGQGVSIGPFCSVSTSAKLGNGCQLHPGSHVFGTTELGDNCMLMTGAVVGDDYPGCTIIGSNNRIGYHAVVGVKCQDMKYKVIGNGNLIMGSCHIAHDCKIGNNNIFANNTLLAGHVEVEDYVHTAGATVVHQFCHLGSFSFLGGGSVVSQDVPKYMLVAGERAELRGLNLVGLTRCGFSDAEIRSLRAAYRKIFMCIDANAGSLEERLGEVELHEEFVHVPAVRAMTQSIRDSFAENRRGVCKFRHWNVS